MAFKSKWSYGESEQFDSVGALVEHQIDGSPGYYDGEIESLRAKVAKMQEIVVKMADMLPPTLARELADSLGYREV